jgi:hypothetical protein
VSGSTSRRKGNRAEVEVAAALRRAGWQAVTTRAANGTQGGADLITDFPMVVEVKNVARTDLSGWWGRRASAGRGRPACRDSQAARNERSCPKAGGCVWMCIHCWHWSKGWQMDERKVAGHCPLCGELAHWQETYVLCGFCGWAGEACVPPRLVVSS